MAQRSQGDVDKCRLLGLLERSRAGNRVYWPNQIWASVRSPFVLSALTDITSSSLLINPITRYKARGSSSASRKLREWCWGDSGVWLGGDMVCVCDRAGGLKQHHLFACGRIQHPGGKGQTWWGGGAGGGGKGNMRRAGCAGGGRGARGTGWVSTDPLVLSPGLLARRFQMLPSLKELLMVRPICSCK